MRLHLLLQVDARRLELRHVEGHADGAVPSAALRRYRGCDAIRRPPPRRARGTRLHLRAATARTPRAPGFREARCRGSGARRHDPSLRRRGHRPLLIHASRDWRCRASRPDRGWRRGRLRRASSLGTQTGVALAKTGWPRAGRRRRREFAPRRTPSPRRPSAFEMASGMVVINGDAKRARRCRRRPRDRSLSKDHAPGSGGSHQPRNGERVGNRRRLADRGHQSRPRSPATSDRTPQAMMICGSDGEEGTAARSSLGPRLVEFASSRAASRCCMRRRIAGELEQRHAPSRRSVTPRMIAARNRIVAMPRRSPRTASRCRPVRRWRRVATRTGKITSTT